MSIQIILASESAVRAQLLENAAISFTPQKPRVDEESVKEALLAEGAKPRDIADTLAELKARKVSEKNPDALVIGCDQVLAFEGGILSKPVSEAEALDHLKILRGRQHSLLSAAVIYEAGKPVWRHVGQVHLSMRDASDTYLKDYVIRNWQSIRFSVGGYKLEEEGVRLFTRVNGDYFTVLGLPLLELIAYLTLRGILPK
ncbi:Maf family protein [Thalassococcus sp. S3]|uniref:Maf family protein n=1 Tax=Thalassococcus sp. S3 TaxID=2017482 RepID=UPI0010242B4A|nr:Maf family protein [Thalassococcus sp. S3]QBF29598.1 septum formation protein Maf [Thalassococcus sp. S3]